jgi:hypothetical protein
MPTDLDGAEPAGLKHWPNWLALIKSVTAELNTGFELFGGYFMGSRRRGSGRRKVGRKKRRMRAKIRHRK